MLRVTFATIPPQFSSEKTEERFQFPNENLALFRELPSGFTRKNFLPEAQRSCL